MGLEAQVEGILFYKAEPLCVSVLAEICEVSLMDTEDALTALAVHLQTRGIVLVREGETVQLMTAQGLAHTLEKIRKEELKRDIGKAGAETLAIIAYRTAVTRAEIDYIRGVNSTFIIRNLLIRGLIERIPNPTDQRSFAYRPSLALYAHLGITKKEELPQYAEMIEEIRKHHTEEAVVAPEEPARV